TVLSCSLLRNVMRRLNFFDRHVVKQEGSEVHVGVQKLNVSCACGTSDSLWLGEAQGDVRRLDGQGKLSPACKVFELKFVDLCATNDLLLAVGTDAPGSANQPGLAKYKILETSADGSPSVGTSHRVFPRQEGQACCIAAYSVGRAGLVAVGSSASSLQLFRAQDLVQEKPYPTTLALEDGSSSSQEVTSIEFLEQGSKVVLFACTRQSVCSWRVWDGGSVVHQELRLLNVDATGGAAPMCACAFPGMNALLVAKPDAVFAYDPEEGNMSAMPLDGQKVILKRFQSYFVVVTSDTSAAPVSFTAGPASMPKQTVTVVLAQKQMRFIAFTSQFTDVTHVVKVLFELQEKPLSERLDVLVKKRMFEWAAEVALTSNGAPEVTAEIYRQHGDALFEKRAYDQALQIYAKTVDLGLPLEPSYVVERYLDAQRIGHVAQYLKKLHEKEMAEAEHTALLLKCYTKLKDFSTLEEFLETTPPSQYDHATAIEVLESASYYGLASEVARKVGRFDDFVRISLEQFKNCSATVEFLHSLPKAEAGRILLQRGRALMRHAPKETIALVRQVCEASDDPQGPSIDELLPVFVDDESQLEVFLRSVLLDEGCQLPPAKAERLFPTLLELLVKSYSAVDGEQAQISADIMRLIRQYPSENALANTLMVCQTYGFVDGFFYAAEKLHRHQLLMQWCFEHKDAKRLLDVCKRCGPADQSLWVQALSFLSSPESGGRHLEEIQEVLRHIEDSDLMPLLLVIETLRHSEEVTIGDVRPYLQAQYKRLVDSLETSRGKSAQDRHEIARMQQEIIKLRTEAKEFQNTRCFQCGLTLDVPAVHFFCGHSYHSYCTPSDGTCPKCSSGALPKLSLKEQREAQARNVEDFFKYLQGGAGDRGVQAMGEWCKFGAFDAAQIDPEDD
ncbi:unnamed protein product, partial [Durusdinium trenchii]